jgi:hypothetical protein
MRMGHGMSVHARVLVMGGQGQRWALMWELLVRRQLVCSVLSGHCVLGAGHRRR